MTLWTGARRFNTNAWASGKRRKGVNPAIANAAKFAVEQLESRIMLSTVHWTATTSGQWSNPDNWTNDTLPGSGDDVVINQPGNIQITSTGPVSVNSITVTGDTLEISSGNIAVAADSSIDSNSTLLLDGGNLSITSGAIFTQNGTATWSNGAIQGGGIFAVANGATLTLSGSGEKDLAGGTFLDNSGTINDSGTGAWHLFGDSQLNNQSGAQINMSSNGSIENGNAAGGTIDNESGATFENTGDTELATSFDNQGGTVDVESGQFAFAGGGTIDGGTLIDNGSGTLDLTGGSTVDISGTITGTGTGSIQLASGDLVVATGGATLNFAPTLFIWTGGTIDLNGNTLTNTGALTFENPQFVSPSSFGGSFVNSATVLQEGELILNNSPANSATLDIDNAVGGVWTIPADTFMIQTGQSLSEFTNSGTLSKVGGSGTLTIDTRFDNAGGTINVESGTIDLRGSEVVTNGNGDDFTMEGGTFNVTTGAELDFDTIGTLGGTLTGSGGGTVLFAGFVEAGPAGLNLNFPGNLLQVTGGFGVGLQGPFAGDPTYGFNISNLGTLTLASDPISGIFSAGPINILGDGEFTNEGTIIQTGLAGLALGSPSGATLPPLQFVNDPGASYLLESDSGVQLYAISGDFDEEGALIVNYGTIEKEDGTGTSQIGLPGLNNFGTIDAATGTIALVVNELQVANNSTMEIAANATITLNMTAGGALGIQSVSGVSGTLTATGQGLFQVLGNGQGQGGLALDGNLTLDFPTGMLQFIGSDIELQGYTLTNIGDVTIIPDLTQNPVVFGDFGGPGQIVNAVDATLQFLGSGSYYEQEGNVAIDNQGTLLLDGNVVYTADPSAGDLPTDSITNEGTIEKTGGTGTAELAPDLTNTGTIQSDAGILQLDSVEPLAAGSIWNALNGSSILMPNAATGFFADDDANITLSGAGAQIGSLATDLNTIDGGGSLTLNDGATLTLSGDLDVASDGTLNIGIGGPSSSGLFGQLFVPGQISYSGFLNVTLVDGYGAAVGDAYQLLFYGSQDPAANQPQETVDPTLSPDGGSAQSPYAGFYGVNVSSSSADLVAESVQSPSSMTVGQNETVFVPVVNFGNVPTNGSNWTDSLYLSADGSLDSSSILLNTQSQTTPLAGGGVYFDAFNFNTPAVLPGNYSLIAVADSGNSIADSDRSNNISISSPVPIDYQAITPGTSIVTSIAAGQSLYFRFDDASEAETLLSAVASTAGAVSMYVSDDSVPTPTQSDLSSAGQAGTTASVGIVNPTAGPYIVLLQGNAAAGFGTGVTLGTAPLGFEISSVTPGNVANNQSSAVTINGYHFTNATTAELIAPGGQTYQPSNLQFVNSNQILATFDFTGLVPGNYSVQVTDTGQVATDSGAVAVGPAEINEFGSITSNETWTAGLVYHLTADTRVESGVTLTIDPGAIIKFDSGVSMIVDGTLLAQGTMTQQIIFTSINDDAHGGDTNGDGNATQPEPGDWGQIIVNGTATFDHVQILYGAGGPLPASTGTIHTESSSAVATFNDSLIANSFYDGLYDDSGTINATNSVITNVDRGVTGRSGVITLINCTFEGNVEGLVGHGETVNATNTLVTDSSQYGVYNFGTTPTLSYSDVFSNVPGSTNYVNAPDQTGANGNISADPNYVDPANGNFQLNYLSPAIDAADGNLSPLTDALGDARYNDPRTPIKTGIADAGGNYPDMGAFEFVETAPSNLDLVVASVSGQVQVQAGQQATVTWTDQNIGTGTVTGSWIDDIQLVDSIAPGGAVTLDAGQYVASGTLGPDQTATFSTTVTVPYGTDGTYYWQVKTNSDGAIFEGANTANNVTMSSAPTQLSLDVVSQGSNNAGVFQTVGDGVLYKVLTTPGQDLDIALNRVDNGITDIYLSAKTAPTPEDFLEHVLAQNNSQANIDITASGTSVYYLLLVPRSLPGGSTTFLVESSAAQLSLSSIGLTSGANSGSVTIPLVGENFLPGVTATLSSGGTIINAGSVQIVDASHAFATFNLQGASTGAYDVNIGENGTTVSLPAAFTITPKTATIGLNVQIVMPTAIRVGRLFESFVTYTNTSASDIPAPIIQITSPTGNLVTLDPSQALTASVDFLALSPDGPAGTLRPGESVTIPVYSMGINSGNQLASSTTVTSTTPYDWNAEETAIEPNGAPAAWTTAYSAAVTAAGPTTGDYLAFLDVIATSETIRTGSLVRNPDQLLENYVTNQAATANTNLAGTVYLGNTSTPLGGANVTATNIATGAGVSALSNADGTVEFQSVPDGSYTFSVSGYLSQTNQIPVSVTGSGPIPTASIVVQQASDIVGRIVAPSGTDLTGEIVSATDENGNIFFSNVNAAGDYDISGLAKGTYTVSFQGTAAIAQPSPINSIVVQTAQVVELADVDCGVGAVVKGTVLDSATENPIVFANITLSSLDGSAQYYATTDSNGNFSIIDAPGGAYSLEIDAEGYVPKTINKLVATPGAAPTTEQVSLSTGASISGTVTSGGAPVADASVEVVSGATDLGQVYTDSSGNYSIGLLPAGTFNLEVSALVQNASSQQVTLSTGQSLTDNISLSVGVGAIQGVFSVHAIPIGGAGIALLGPGGTIYTTTTNADGSFGFGSLSDGTYTLMLQGGDNRQSVTLAGAGDLQTVNITPDMGAINGTVYLPDGVTGDAGAYVALMSNGQIVASEFAGSNGQYQFLLVAPGTYQVVTEDGSYTFAPQTVVVVPDSSSSTPAPNLIPGTASLTVSAVDAFGSTLAGDSVVSIISLDFPQMDAEPIVADLPGLGSATFSDLAPGNYMVEVATPGGILSQKVTVAPGDASVQLKLSPVGTLSGSIIAANGGTALSGITVTVYQPSNPRALVQTTTDSTGSYSIVGLAAGAYTVIFSDDSGNSAVMSTTETGVAVIANATVTESATLAAPAFTLTGLISGGSSNLPSSGLVYALNADGVAVGFGGIDADGNYEIDTLAPGTYTLLGAANGFVVNNGSVTVTPGETAATANLTAAWAVDLPTALSTSLSASVSPNIPFAPLDTSWNDLVSSVLQGIGTILQEPQRAPGLAPFIQPPCNCPAAQAAIIEYNNAQGFDFIASTQFTAWHDEWDAAVQTLPADTGLVGANLFLFAVVLAASPAALQVAVAGSIVGRAATSLSNAFGQVAGSKLVPSVVKNISASFASLQAEVQGFVGAEPFGAPNTLLASGAGDGGGAVMTEAGISAPGVLGPIKQMFQDMGTFASNVSVQNFETVVGDLLNIAGFATTILTSAQVLGAAAGAAGALTYATEVAYAGAVISLMNSVLSVAKGLTDGFQAINNYLDDHNTYNQTIAKRDADKEASDQYLLIAAFQCYGSQVIPVPLPPAITVHNNPTPPVVFGSQSFDPNDKTSTGFGAQGFILPGQTVNYTVDFENDPTATAPAQEVVITDQLSSDIDWSTVQLTSINFNNDTINIPAGLQNFSTQTTVSTDPNPVEVTATFNPTTGLLTYIIESINPITGGLVSDPLAGFLPPDNSDGDGEGYVTYSAAPVAGLADQTQIDNQASIVFDTNAPILTPIAVNTIDSVAPTSSVLALPTTESSAAFTVNWAGQDQTGGSGIANYDVYVSDNGGAYTLFQQQTTDTSGLFTGQDGHTYSFYSVATDNVGNVQSLVAQATTTVAVAPAITSFVVNAGAAQRSMVTQLTLVFNEPVALNNAISLLQQATGNGSATPMNFSIASSDQMTWTLTFPSGIGGSLPDGTYGLVVTAADVTGVSSSLPMAGDNQTFTFDRLFGDIDGNGIVNNADYLQFKFSYAKLAGSAGYNAGFDYDANGVINNADYFQFKKRYGTSVVAPQISSFAAAAALLDGSQASADATISDQILRSDHKSRKNRLL